MAMRESVIWLKGERAPQKRQRLRRAVRHCSLDERRRTKHEIISVQTLRSFALDALDLGLPQVRLDRADDAEGDLVLQCEDVVNRAIVAFSPDVPAALGLDQLAGDADAVRRPTHAALEHVAHPELAADLADI